MLNKEQKQEFKDNFYEFEDYLLYIGECFIKVNCNENSKYKIIITYEEDVEASLWTIEEFLNEELYNDTIIDFLKHIKK